LRFNPRARVGRDLIEAAEGFWMGVSIHAPVWGATGDIDDKLKVINRFNPRARVGRDWQSPATWCHCWQFQSTRPCGARPVSHELIDRKYFVSIHAPVWGATQTSTAQIVQF